MADDVVKKIRKATPYGPFIRLNPNSRIFIHTLAGRIYKCHVVRGSKKSANNL